MSCDTTLVTIPEAMKPTELSDWQNIAHLTSLIIFHMGGKVLEFGELPKKTKEEIFALIKAGVTDHEAAEKAVSLSYAVADLWEEIAFEMGPDYEE